MFCLLCRLITCPEAKKILYQKMQVAAADDDADAYAATQGQLNPHKMATRLLLGSFKQL